MASIVPFRALRPRKQYVKEVASLPYDVVSREEAKRMADDSSLNFLHVEKSDIDLPAGIAAHDPRIYGRAKRNLDRLIEAGVLFQEEKACFYVYSQGMNGFRQYGIVGGVSVAEYESGKIKKHELTRADKERDRILHVDMVNAHTGPVFLTYRARPAIDRFVERATATAPVYDFTTNDGISHTVWIVGEEETVSNIIREFADVESLYIADGHHRAAAAAAVAKMRRERRQGPGNAEYENIMAVLFPHGQLKVMAYNRVVKDLNGLRRAEFLEKCGNIFTITADFKDKSPGRLHEFGMYIGGGWYKLSAKTGDYEESDPVGRLDVSILQDRLLGPVLGVQDARTNNRIEFVGGMRGMEELERLVDSGEFSAAFALYPLAVEQLMEVADAGRLMPPKSTWFEPKLRSGIFTHLLE